MKPIVLALCLALLAAPPAAAEPEACFSRKNAPYWHRDKACRFAESDWMAQENLGEETRLIEAARAEAEGQKPCPGCATAFAPTFTGDFPEWPHELAPWGYESGEMIDDGGWPRGEFELPEEILKTWGAPDEKLNELFPDAGDFEEGGSSATPDDYAGIFVNACGGYTILLVDPTPERVAEWRELLQGEFWVLSARYGYDELKTLARTVSHQILSADSDRRGRGEDSWYHIVSVGVAQIANAVEIGVTPDGYDEGVRRIREALADAGYTDPGMFRFVPANYPGWL